MLDTRTVACSPWLAPAGSARHGLPSPLPPHALMPLCMALLVDLTPLTTADFLISSITQTLKLIVTS